MPLHSSSGSYASIQNKFKFLHARNTESLSEMEHSEGQSSSMEQCSLRSDPEKKCCSWVGAQHRWLIDKGL